MQDVIVFQGTVGSMSFNFDDAKRFITDSLEPFKFLVTADTLKDAKEKATELNAKKKEMDALLKDAINKASEPIKTMDDQRKELVAMCESARQEILAQVKRFEDETRKLALELLEAYRIERWNALGVVIEFRRADISDLAIISSVTGKGSLALSARRSVDERVMADAAVQDKTDRRLLVLENLSLRAGLASPLTRDHVNSFLFQPDDVYQAQLDRIIASEINRQNEAETKLREKIALENKRAEEEREAAARLAAIKSVEQVAAPVEPVQQPAPQPVQQSAPQPAQRPMPEPASVVNQSAPVVGGDTVACFIVCSFELQVDPRAPDEMIRQKFMQKMQDAGFQSLVSVRVTKQKAAA